MGRYEILLGFNTKQWWVFDNELDTYIDIPSAVLNDVREKFGSIRNNDTIEEQEKYLKKIVATNPNWLNDKSYFYNEIE